MEFLLKEDEQVSKNENEILCITIRKCFTKINTATEDNHLKPKTMFEQLKFEMGLSDIPVRIEFVNGKVKYGIIVDYVEKEATEIEINDLKFISYNDLSKYENTENPVFIEKLKENSVRSIDMILK